MDGHEATATSVATASANGVIENHATVTIAEAKKELGLDPDGKVGEVLAARIIDTARKMAFERASKYAIADAKKQGLLKATAAAESLAEAQAEEEARLKAERMANEAAAWHTEAGGNGGTGRRREWQ